MGNNKRVIINMIANGTAFLVQFVINFFLTPYLTESVGASAYGFVTIANNFVGYINIFTIALNSMASRFITIEYNRKNLKLTNTYFNSVLYANTVLALVVLFFGVPLSLNINHVLRVPEDIVNDVRLTFIFVFFNIALSLLFSVYGVVFYVKNRLDISARRNIEGNILRAICIAGLFVMFQPKIYFITLTALFMALYIGIANFYHTHQLLPDIKIGFANLSLGAIKTLLAAGIWNSINQLSTVLLTSLDILLANLFVGATASGQYAIAKIVPNFIQSLVAVLTSAFIPDITILYAERKREELLNKVNYSIKMMGWLITLPIAFLIIFGQNFFELWVPSEDAVQLHILSLWTLIPMIVTGSINTIFNVYTVTNKLKLPSLVLLITGIINTVLVLVLLKFTTLGIIVIPLVSCIIGLIRNLVFTPIYAAKCLDVKWSTFYFAIIRGVFCTIVMVMWCLVFKHIFTIDSWGIFLCAAVACATLTLSINFWIVFNKRERQEFLSFLTDKRGEK